MGRADDGGNHRHCSSPLKFVDDLDIDSRGGIWFSDASQRFDYTEVALGLFEVTGRLFAMTPDSNKS